MLTIRMYERKVLPMTYEHKANVSRRCKVMCLSLVAAGLLMGQAALAQESESELAAKEGIASCEIIVPQGDYSLVTLTFETPDAPDPYKSWSYRGGMRDGRMPVDDGVGLREPGGCLTLTGGRLRGEFRYRLLKTDFVTVAVDAVVQDGVVSGAATIDGMKGAVSGEIVSESQLAAANPVPEDKSWPAFLGPAGGGCAAEPAGAELIDSMFQAELEWRSEAPLPQGLSPLSRFMDTWSDASGLRTGGGAASPILADGCVFVSYYVPSPASVNGSKLDKLRQTAKQRGINLQPLPEYALEKVYAAADDVVLCIDAATGKTLWKAVVEGRGHNHQHHKEGPFNMSPAYGDGKVFAMGMSGFIYAFDATTGKPLWEAPYTVQRDLKTILAFSSHALLVADDVLVAPHGDSWAGFDTDTGRQLWRLGDLRSHTTLARWPHGGKEYLVGVVGPRWVRNQDLICLEAATGKRLWQLPINIMSAGRGLGPGGISIYKDYLLAYRQDGPEEESTQLCTAWRLTTEKPELLWDVVLPPTEKANCKENVPVVLAEKFVFTGRLQVIDLESGKVLSQARGTTPGNGGYIEGMENLVLVRRDGTHGALEIAAYKVSPDGAVKALDELLWMPFPSLQCGGGTTSYHHPIMYPMVAGRMFLRQYDGIYCWDLRSISQ